MWFFFLNIGIYNFSEKSHKARNPLQREIQTLIMSLEVIKFQMILTVWRSKYANPVETMIQMWFIKVVRIYLKMILHVKTNLIWLS